MAPSIRVLDIADGAGDQTVTASDLDDGELLICFADTDNGNPAGISAPSGWTQLQLVQALVSGEGMKLYQRDTPANGSYTFNILSGSDGSVVLCALTPDQAGELSIDDVDGVSADDEAPSVTAADDDSLLVVYWMKTGNNANAMGAPAGMDVWLDNHQSSGWGRRLGVSETVDAGPTGTRELSSSNGHCAFSLVVSESGGAEPVPEVTTDIPLSIAVGATAQANHLVAADIPLTIAVDPVTEAPAVDMPEVTAEIPLTVALGAATLADHDVTAAIPLTVALGAVVEDPAEPEPEPVDVTVTIGPTRLRPLATVGGPTRFRDIASTTATRDRAAATVAADTRDRAIATVAADTRDRAQAEIDDDTRLGAEAGDTRLGADVGPTRVERQQ